MNKSSSTTGADMVALCSAIAMLVAFLFLPFVSLGMLSLSALKVLTVANDMSTDSTSANGAKGFLTLFLIVAICCLATAIWGLRSPSHKRAASIVTALLGALMLLPLAWGLIQSGQGSINLGGVLGIGYWVMLLAAIGLVVQVFLSRPTGRTAPPTTSSTTSYGQ